MGALMAFAVNTLGANLIITGIAMNLAASSGTTLGLFFATGDKGMSGALKSGVMPSIDLPFVGDIPVIGKLFRNKYELSEKRNLLLFVTARLVDPAGREVKDSTNDGMALLTEGQ